MPVGRMPRSFRVDNERERGVYPSREELVRMVDACPGWREKALVLFLAQSGARVSLACALRVRDVIDQLDFGWVLKTIVWDKEQRTRFGLKNANVICFGTEACEYIKKMLEERRKWGELVTEYSWLFRSYAKSRGWVKGAQGVNAPMPRRDQFGDPLQPWWVNVIVQRSALKAGVMQAKLKGEWAVIHAHSLRKFFYNACISARMLDIHREYLMNHTIDKTKKAYFDSTHQGREEVLRAYQEAYPYLSVRVPFQVPSGLAKQILEIEARVRDRESQIDQLQKTVETILSVHGYDQKRIQEIIERAKTAQTT
jgi:integrase